MQNCLSNIGIKGEVSGLPKDFTLSQYERITPNKIKKDTKQVIYCHFLY
jgi:hypothetical protein